MNMRKIIFAAAAVVAGMSLAASAEVHPHAIGVRFGSGWEINYQLGLGQANRFEIGGGFDFWEGNSWDNGPNDYGYESRSSIGAFGAYQWYWNISPSVARGGFNWYAGPGAGLGFWSWSKHHNDRRIEDASGLNIDLGGQIGIEYDFNALGAPIVVDIDMRPVIGIGFSGGRRSYGYGGRAGWSGGGIGLSIINLGLGVRYTF